MRLHSTQHLPVLHSQMVKINMANYSTYFAIEKKIKRMGIPLERNEWIAQFTEGKKSGLTQLTPHEYREFIIFMNQILKVDSVQKQKEIKQRRKVIALFAQMGYITDEQKSDMQRIHDWCIKYGHLHKDLNAYTGSDLTKLVTQAQEVYNTFIRDLKV